MLLDRVTDFVSGFLPDSDLTLILFLLGQQAAAEVAVDNFNGLERFINNVLAFRRDGDIGYSKCGSPACIPMSAGAIPTRV